MTDNDDSGRRDRAKPSRDTLSGVWPHIVSTFWGVGVAAVMVTLWGGQQAARIDVLEARLRDHGGMVGHTGMMSLERSNQADIRGLQIQDETIRRELDSIRRYCPELREKLSPTTGGYKSPHPPGPIREISGE